MLLLVFLLFSWALVRGVFPNYEVAMFQSPTMTPLDLVSVANCYVDIVFNPLLPSPSTAQFLPGGSTHARHSPLFFSHRRVSTQGHSSTWVSPVSVSAYWGPSIGCILRRNSVYSGTFLLYPEKLRYHIPPENGKITKKEFQNNVSSVALNMIKRIISYWGLP